MLLHCRQGVEKILQVVSGVDAEFAAGFNKAVDDGTGLAGVGASEKKEVLFADGGGANGVFNEVVVDFERAVVEIMGEVVPAGQGIVDGYAEFAFGKLTRLLHLKDRFNLFKYGGSFLLPDGGAVEVGVLAEFGFGAVELCDEFDDFAGDGVGGFYEFPSCVRPAFGMNDLLFFLSMLWVVQPARVGSIAVAL